MSNLRKIVMMGGSVPVVAGTTCEFGYDRFAKWYLVDPERAVREALGDDYRDVRDTRDLTVRLIKRFRISESAVHFLQILHEKFAKFYIWEIEAWIMRNPERVKELDMHFTDTQNGANYTDAMNRLKNLRYTNWDGTQVKGFCKMEPEVRIRQLLKLDTSIFEFDVAGDPSPQPPEIQKHVVKITDLETARNAIDNARSTLSQYEKYYTELCEYIENLQLRKVRLDNVN